MKIEFTGEGKGFIHGVTPQGGVSAGVPVSIDDAALTAVGLPAGSSEEFFGRLNKNDWSIVESFSTPEASEPAVQSESDSEPEKEAPLARFLSSFGGADTTADSGTKEETE